MTSLADRILEIRTANELSQAAFAEQLNLSQNFIWMIEKGQRDPSDRTISDICRIFSIREEWLRNGTGDMEKPVSREEEISNLVGQALDGSSEFKLAVIRMICSRSDSELQTLESALRNIYEQL